jgi:hypothetical protein
MRNSKLLTYLALIIIALYVLTNAYFLKLKYEKNPGIDEQDIKLGKYLLDFYPFSKPNIIDFPFIGNENAEITVVVYIDSDSDRSRKFIEDIYPQIYDEFIRTNIIRLYPKEYITSLDIEQNTSRYYAKIALKCVGEYSIDKYYAFFEEIFTGNDPVSSAKKNKISPSKLDECMVAGESIKNAYVSAAEIESLGFVGINQRIYIGIEGRDNSIIDGIPDYDELKQVIRLQQLKIGN